MFKLTDQFAASAKHTANGDRTVYPDTELTGFRLVVFVGGQKAWYYTARINYKLFNRKLGALQVMNCREARNAAKQLAGQLHAGVDVTTERRQAAMAEKAAREERKNAMTIAQAVAEYLVNAEVKEATILYYSKLLANGLKPYAQTPLVDVNGEWIMATYKKIAEAVTPLHATRCINFVRTLCLSQDMDNPIPNRLKKAQSKPRHARLEPSDGIALWKRLQGHINKPAGAYLATMMLTGCRTAELNTLKVGDVDLLEGYFRLYDTKNGTDHKVYLSPVAARIIEEMMYDKDPEDLVFTRANYGRELAKSLQAPKAWSNHDLRKMMSITAMELGIAYPVIKAMLNHSTSDVTIKHYAQATPSQLRAAWQKITDFYTEQTCTTSTPTSNTLYALPNVSMPHSTSTTPHSDLPVKRVNLRIA